MVNGKKVKKNITCGLLYKLSKKGTELYYDLTCRVRGFPVNKWGSIVPDFRIVDPLVVAAEFKKPEIDRVMDIFLWARKEKNKVVETNVEVTVWTDDVWAKNKVPDKPVVLQPVVVKKKKPVILEADTPEERDARNFLVDPKVTKLVTRLDREDKSEVEILKSLMSYRVVNQDEEYKIPKPFKYVDISVKNSEDVMKKVKNKKE